MRRYLIAALLLTATGAWAGGVAVPLDEVRIVTFAKPVSTLYVGNPLIADVNMIDKRHAFVQGKAFGTTHLVALDETGRQIASDLVVVAGAGGGLVTLQRGMAQTTYACTSARCDATPTPGDSKDTYETALDQMTKHQSLLTKAATSEGQ
jgi:Pilus formation protein N terminal region